MTVATVAGRTVREVARSIRRSPGETLTVLEELRESGIAMEVDEGIWRLTETAETRFGAKFRALPSWLRGEPV